MNNYKSKEKKENSNYCLQRSTSMLRGCAAYTGEAMAVHLCSINCVIGRFSSAYADN